MSECVVRGNDPTWQNNVSNMEVPDYSLVKTTISVLRFPSETPRYNWIMNSIDAPIDVNYSLAYFMVPLGCILKGGKYMWEKYSTQSFIQLFDSWFFMIEIAS